MKVSVRGDLKADVIAVDRAEKMMPLQDLVEQNPIEEAAEGKAKHIAGPWMGASG
jgi:hypothetical protein